MSPDPILSSPPAFVLLVGMVGLGAYLRGLAEARLKTIEEIKANKLTDFPTGAKHREQKLQYLDQSRHYLNVIVAPVAIWLTIALVARLAVLAYVHLLFTADIHRFDRGFRLFDAVFMTALFVFFLWLARMHYRSRKNEDKINNMLAVWLDSQQKSETGS